MSQEKTSDGDSMHGSGEVKGDTGAFPPAMTYTFPSLEKPSTST